MPVKYCQNNWSRSLTKFENRSLTREFLQQYLIERQNGSLERWSFMGGGRLLEVVATRELTVYAFQPVALNELVFLLYMHDIRHSSYVELRMCRIY